MTAVGYCIAAFSESTELKKSPDVAPLPFGERAIRSRLFLTNRLDNSAGSRVFRGERYTGGRRPITRPTINKTKKTTNKIHAI